MALHGWIHEEQSPASQVGPAALLRGAAHGATLQWLLQTAARDLVEAGGAACAGVWLLRDSQPAFDAKFIRGNSPRLEGVFLEANDGLASERWTNSRLNSPDILTLMHSSEEEILLRGTESELLRPDSIAPSPQTLWLPLRNAGKPVGLAYVAWSRESAPVAVAQLRSLADAFAVSSASASTSQEKTTQQRDLSPVFSADEISMRSAEAEAALASVADSTESGIVLFDSQGTLRLANERFTQLFGLSQKEVASAQTWNSLSKLVSVCFGDPENMLKRWREIANHPAEANWDELELVHPERRTLERFGRPVLDARGALIARLEIYRDVTTRRLVESKLLRTEKLAGLGQLVSGIAHELNNPLTSILGYSQLLLGRRLTMPQQADARLIHQEAERAAQIVKNLLLFVREARPERRAVNLNETVERTTSLRNYELRVENIELTQDLGQELPPVMADPAQLQQVFLNLLINAEQAIRQGRGEGTIRVRTRKSAAGRVIFEISDSGPGIPQEIIPQIFDPFFSTKPFGTGTGLGLSITSGIVKEHGGEISVQSQLGHGAKFIVELPAADVAPIPVSSPPKNRNVVPAPVRIHRAANVLIIEDEPTVAHLIADVLIEEGFTAEIVLDGRDGLERAARGDYALIICDLRMPHLDGRAIYRELSAKGNPMRHKLMFVTGDTLAPRALEFLEKSGLPFLAKPFLVEELKAVVERALSRTEESNAAVKSTLHSAAGTGRITLLR